MFLEIIKLINIDSLDIFGQYSIGQGEYLTNQLREYYIENNDIPPVNETYKIYHTGNTYKFTPIDNAVVLPLTYYKGYEIKDVKREYSYTEETGLIKVNDVKSNELYVTYKGTTVQKVSLIISIVSFICICIFIKKQRKNPLP